MRRIVSFLLVGLAVIQGSVSLAVADTNTPSSVPTRGAAAGIPSAFPMAGTPWKNSLGMEFLPVPGLDVLFSKWKTRVNDFGVFDWEQGDDYTGDRSNPNFIQEPTHPVVNVNWESAQAFCRWLTEREQTAGHLDTGQRDRLPTDEE